MKAKLALFFGTGFLCFFTLAFFAVNNQLQQNGRHFLAGAVGSGLSAVDGAADNTHPVSKAQITGLYRTLLRREASADELNYWYSYGSTIPLSATRKLELITTIIKMSAEYKALQSNQPTPVVPPSTIQPKPVTPPPIQPAPVPVKLPLPPIGIQPAPTPTIMPVYSGVQCYLLLTIKEKKVGNSIIFSLAHIEEKKGQYFGTLVEPYYPEDGADYILETYSGGAAKTGSYALYSSRFLIAENFDQTSPKGSILEASEGVVEVYLPNDPRDNKLMSVTINNNGKITEFGKGQPNFFANYTSPACRGVPTSIYKP